MVEFNRAWFKITWLTLLLNIFALNSCTHHLLPQSSTQVPHSLNIWFWQWEQKRLNLGDSPSEVKTSLRLMFVADVSASLKPKIRIDLIFYDVIVVTFILAVHNIFFAIM